MAKAKSTTRDAVLKRLHAAGIPAFDIEDWDILTMKVHHLKGLLGCTYSAFASDEPPSPSEMAGVSHLAFELVCDINDSVRRLGNKEVANG